MTESSEEGQATPPPDDWYSDYLRRARERRAAKAALLARAVEKLKKGESAERLTVRALLEMFNKSRRGRWVVELVRSELATHGLTTVPDFEATGYDSLVSLEFIPPTPTPVEVDHVGTTAAVAGSVVEKAEGEDELTSDPLAIGGLPSARTKVVWVKPEDDITVATTQMHLNDFSQLPVLRGERDVKGIISWKSIGQAVSLRRTEGQVKDFMTDVVHVVDAKRPLFEVLPELERYEVVLVRDEEKKICGLVTAADMALAFRTMFEPFMLLSDIEAHLRRVITGHFSIETVKKSVDPSDEVRVVQSADDLTFGEYVRLLENPDNWVALHINLDRSTFIRTLDHVREVRNEVMHFSTDPIEEQELSLLRKFSATLRWIK